MKNKFWGFMIVLSVICAYLLPYTILSNVHVWYGSFLLWGIVGIVIIISNIMITKDWSE